MNEDCLNDVTLKDKTNNNNVIITDNNNDAMIDKPSTSTCGKNIISNRYMQVLPTDIKPFPRVTATKENQTFQRKKKKSQILTNTSVLENLEEEEKLKEARNLSLNRNSSF
ncbi:hypothetical protein HHI36_019975 [Cryptolaemus montrouzieri]|uniref:Uncharacterized protein n=1 Tax=Cryptolaemus montrouzieri TaxID=559131 RepID=A0ABD2N932_9CUCU